MFEPNPGAGRGKDEESGVQVIGGRYRLPFDPWPDAEGPRYKRLKDGSTSWQRTSTLVNAIQDGYALRKWGQRMVAKGLSLRPSLVALAASLDLKAQRDEMDALCSRARDAADANKAADNGTAIHAYIEQLDRGIAPAVPKEFRADVAAWNGTLAAAGFKITHNEQILINGELGVMGKLDRVAELIRPMIVRFKDRTVKLLGGEHVIVDLKTVRSLEYAEHEISCQLGVYSRADFYVSRAASLFVPPHINQDVGFVIHLPAGKGMPELWAVDIDRGYRGAQLCVDVMNWRAENDLMGHQSLDLGEEVSRVAVKTIAAAQDESALREVVAYLKAQNVFGGPVRQAALKKLAQLKP